MKKTIFSFNKMKKDGNPIAWITAYSYPMAYAAEQAGIDMILVGDSGGMVELGYRTTNPVTMDEMILLAKAARRGAPNTFIVGDMPQASYEISNELAITNAMRFVKEAGCDAIKLEGGVRVAERIKAISNAGIVVVGHLGLTPQSTASFGGYRVQGKTKESLDETIVDALSVENNGASFLLLEAMPEISAFQVVKNLKIPVLGIGAGKIDGQLIIMHDLLGFYHNFRPWFAKSYVPIVIDEFAKKMNEVEDIKKFGIETRNDGLNLLCKMAISKYISEVKEGLFPDINYNYPIKKEELEDIKNSKYWK